MRLSVLKHQGEETHPSQMTVTVPHSGHYAVGALFLVYEMGVLSCHGRIARVTHIFSCDDSSKGEWQEEIEILLDNGPADCV